MKPVAVLLCPGRGAYGRDELGSIHRNLKPGSVADALAAADAERRRTSRPTVSELDGAGRFRPGTHLDGENAAELIYFATMSWLGGAEMDALSEQFEIAAVAGNSLGWYTALVAAGALDPVSGWRLVSTMARLQKAIAGGQVLTTTVDEDWRTAPELVDGVVAALEKASAAGRVAARSIRLGGHEVLAGDEAAVQLLLAELPAVRVGRREFPFRLAGHGPFHTVLCEPTARAANVELGDLPVRTPRVHLIDGTGNVHSPWSADPEGLLRYTLTTQVTETFDFTAAVRTAIREFNPDVLLCAGPGTSLRAPVGHVVLREGYRGLRDKQALFAADLVREGVVHAG